MKNKRTGVAALMAAGWIGLCMCAAGAIEVISVRDYGAKGDGKTDDTTAIQTAVDAARKARRTVQGKAEGGRTEVPLLNAPKLYFPAGNYLVTHAIDISHVLTIEADPYATLNQKHPEKDILFSRDAWYLNIRGLSFIGGAVQLNLYNPNVAAGVVTVNDCVFWNANQWALVVDIESTTFTMNNGHIFNAMQGMFLSRCDVVMVRDGWWLNDRRMKNRAFIENRAQRVMFQNICANPRVNGFDQRWVDNYGTDLTMQQIRFGGEGGGFTPVVNFSKPRASNIGTSIVIEDSWCCNTANAKREAIVYCEEIPNLISLRDNNVSARHLVQFADTLDLKRYFREKGVPRSFLSFQASGNIGGLIEQELPRGLVKPVAATDVSLARVSNRTAKRLAANAVAEWTAKGLPDTENGESNGHRQQTDAARFVDINLRSATWDVDETLDASRIRNREFLTFAQAGTDTLWIWKREGDLWPHVTIKDIEVDLDRYPFLTWATKPASAPAGWLVRVILRDEGIAANVDNVESIPGEPAWRYRAHDLRKLLGLGGKRKLEVRIYLSAWEWIPGKGYVGGAANKRLAAPGSYGVFDFIRFEAE